MTAISIRKVALLVLMLVLPPPKLWAQPSQAFSRIWFGDGTASAPSMAFTADTNTGIYRIGADRLGIATGGTARIDIGSTSASINLPIAVGTGADPASFIEAAEPRVVGGVFDSVYTGAGASTNTYGFSISANFNPSTNSTTNYTGLFVQGLANQTTARTSGPLTGVYGAVYSDRNGNATHVSGVIGDGEWGGTGTATSVSGLNAAYWGTYDPSVGSPGHVTTIAGVHVGQPFHGGNTPDNVRGIWIEDVTAGGTISTTASSIFALHYTNPSSQVSGIGRGGAFVEAPGTVTVADNGNGGTAAAATLTPITGLVKGTCSDAQGCDITMGETNVNDGQRFTFVNVSTNTFNFADTSGVSELAGTAALGQWDSISMMYVSDRWVEVGRSNN